MGREKVNYSYLRGDSFVSYLLKELVSAGISLLSFSFKKNFKMLKNTSFLILKTQEKRFSIC